MSLSALFLQHTELGIRCTIEEAQTHEIYQHVRDSMEIQPFLHPNTAVVSISADDEGSYRRTINELERSGFLVDLQCVPKRFIEIQVVFDNNHSAEDVLKVIGAHSVICKV